MDLISPQCRSICQQTQERHRKTSTGLEASNRESSHVYISFSTLFPSVLPEVSRNTKKIGGERRNTPFDHALGFVILSGLIGERGRGERWEEERGKTARFRSHGLHLSFNPQESTYERVEKRGEGRRHVNE